MSKGSIRFPVSYHIAVGDVVVRILHIFLHESGIGFPGGSIVLREVAVDKNIVEGDAFALQCLKDEIVDRPERILRKGICTQAILIADHHKLEVGVLADEVKVTEHALGELQFLKGVYLLVGRLLDEGAVAVDE